MSGIQIHTDAPINKSTAGSAGSAPGSHPSTAAPTTTAAASNPSTTPATTTTAAAQQSPYAPQPGAAAPAPTGNPYAPAPSTTQGATGTLTGPPAPQPGATPVPSAAAPSAAAAIPPPPKVGEAVQPPSYYEAPRPQHMPPQMGVAPLGDPRGAGAPIGSVTGASVPPPGWAQGGHGFGHQQQSNASGWTAGEMGGGGAGGLNLGGEEGVWEAAKGWMNTAGKKVAELEGEAWKKINEYTDPK